MPTCTTCHISKRHEEFEPGSKKCDICKSRVKVKKQPKPLVQGYNDNHYLVGMFIGEFKGLKAYF